MARPDDPGRPDATTSRASADERIVTPGMATRPLPGDGGVIADAGEYVLGTLDDAEHARFERQAETDPEARRLAAFWRDRLGPLDEVAAPIAPPASVWAAIEKALPDGPVLSANDNELRAMRLSRNGWRGFALLAASLLVGGTLLAASPQLRGELERRLGLPGPVSDRPVVAGLEGESYLAVVNAEGKLPAMIVRVDAATGRVSVRPLALARPEGRSLELWHVAQGAPAPISMGLLDEGATIREVDAEPGDTFAVTEEAVGGAPGGAPTGPIILSGQLVREPD